MGVVTWQATISGKRLLSFTAIENGESVSRDDQTHHVHMIITQS